jgi:hypothetical protein
MLNASNDLGPAASARTGNKGPQRSGRLSPRGDVGSLELGFAIGGGEGSRGASRSSLTPPGHTATGQPGNTPGSPPGLTLSHDVATLRACHDHQVPPTALGPFQPLRPTRHAPWRSDAERLMIAAESSLRLAMTREVSR